MAARGQELNTRITATNEASAVFNQAGQDAERLEGSLDRLTNEERKIVLEAEASKLEREVDRAYKSLATLRDQDKIDIVIDAKDQAREKLRAVREQIDRLDAEQAVVEVDADTTKARSAVDELGDIIEGKLGGSLGSVAELMTGKGGIAAGAGLLVGGLAAAADKAADLAIEAANLATLTGDTVERSSALGGVFRQAGIEGKDLQDIVLQMNGVLSQSPELAAKLGVDLGDGATAGERFVEIVDRLGSGFEDAGTRSQLASQLFGEEGVRQVNAVRNAFGELGEAVDDYTGKIFTANDAQEAFRAKQQIAEYKQDWEDFTVDAGQLALDVAEKTKTAFLVPARFMESLAGGYNAFDTSATTAAIEDSERAAQAFDRSILSSFDSASQVHDAVLAITGDLHAANIISAEWANTNKAVADTMTSGVSPAASIIAIIANQIDAAADRFARFGSDGVENMGAVESAADDTTDAIAEIEDAFADLRREIDQRQEYRSLEDQFARVEQAAVDAWNAAATGADDAEAQARDYQAELDALREKVLDYGDTIVGLPDQFTTNIIALLDAGKVAEAEAWMARVATGVTLPIKPQVINTGGNTAIRVDENGNVRNVPPRASHTGSVVTAGERVRVLSGQEVEFTAPGAGRVFSREDVGRDQSGSGGGVVVYETHHHYHTTNQVGVEVVQYGNDDMYVDDLANRLAFRFGGAG